MRMLNVPCCDPLRHQLVDQVSTLEAENKRLARALQREVGEDVPLAKMLEDGSDWKGRREQVIALKDQIRQLKAQQVPALTDSVHAVVVLVLALTCSIGWSL
jgi:hypothetical protein